jgi:CTP synthase
MPERRGEGGARKSTTARERVVSRLPKIIVVTGGVLSGLGKGITCASIGNILKRRGFRVNLQKFDPYLNSDAGTLNPGEHGEVFVTDDGGETDLDLGHYERFLDERLTKDSSVMAGSIYARVIENERRGTYLGRTVQVIPHVTDTIKEQLWSAARRSRCDIHIVEIGGTVGDYEGVVFHEAMRQLRLDVGQGGVLYVHLVFLPHLEASGEVKTKPAQNSVRDLRNIGIQPDVLIVRSDHPVPKRLMTKLSQFTNVQERAIVPLQTLPSVYEVPLVMEQYALDHLILEHFQLRPRPQQDGTWQKLVHTIRRKKAPVTIAMVGKYLVMRDTYMSLVEALKAAAWANGRDLDLWWIDAEEIESGTLPLSALKRASGVVVPGGFGKRGTEGKIRAIQYAREERVPYLGLCLGMQLAVVEFARNVLQIPTATSEEFHPKAEHRVIHLMAEQKSATGKGGTMRLGAWLCVLREGTRVRSLYGQRRISERHRHRYEFNNAYRERMEKRGLRTAGTTTDRTLVEIVELAGHPFFVGVQFHPEFQSRPTRPHPLFHGFIRAAVVRGHGQRS